MTKLVPVLFRLEPEVLGELQALAQRTRVRQSEYLREAVKDLLVKYRAIERIQSGEEIAGGR